MATPVWTTTAGKLASIDEQVSFSLQLEANTSDSTAIIYSVIAGSLPSGMELTSTGLLTGIPAEVAKRTRYTFVVRATAGTQITDRSFSLDVEGQDDPTFTTASGQLQIDDSTSTGLYWVLDGSQIGFQVQASDVDTRRGHQLIYEVVSGELPPGIKMSKTGLLSGIVRLTDADFEDSTASSGYSKVLAKSFEFTVRVTDGTSISDQDNSIFVYSADYFRVSNSQITVDQTVIGNSKLTVDYSSNRRPIFQTASDLGTFRHDNLTVIKIDVEDLDPLQEPLTYSIQSGALPSGLSINASTGEISGSLARQDTIETTFTFTIRVNREVATGINVFTDQTFTMKVIGEIDLGIAFTTPESVGTVVADRPCLLTIEAVAEEANRVLTYSVTSGSLPTGITLSPQGNLIGTVDASDFTDSTTTFNFTVTVSDQYQSSATSKEFRLDVDIPFTTVEYGSMTGDSTSLIDQNIFYNIAQDQNINSNEYIYRGEDPNFGIKVKPEILIITGIEAQTLTIFQNQMQQNHSPKTLFFGDVKTAVAKENGVIKYEVVYIDIVDPLVNNDGNAVSSSVSVYNDSSVFPNALANMRTRMKELGHKEWTHLPLWMKTTQEGDLAPLGWVPASVICYCKPGTSALLKKRIDDKGLIFRNIDFVVDRYRVNKSVVTPAKFTGDGSTTTFELDEIVHEEDILVKEEGVRVFVGEGVRADGSLEADSNLRSADHEFGIELTHDTSALKTTINFIKSAPSDGSIITVDRLNDKYLKFRDKGY